MAILENSISSQGGYTINKAQSFLEDARKSFALAANAVGQKETERYAAIGRDYLSLAHQASTVDAVPATKNFWNLP